MQRPNDKMVFMHVIYVEYSELCKLTRIYEARF